MIRALLFAGGRLERLADLGERAEIVLAFEHDDLDAFSARFAADFSHHVHIARISRTKAVRPARPAEATKLYHWI